MTTIQLREELFREINPILDDEGLLLKLLKYARKLTATKADDTLVDKEEFMDSLELVTIATHVADCKTMLLHPASHTHRQLSDEQLKEAGIPADLIRFSVGLENPDDIIEDIKKALDKI